MRIANAERPAKNRGKQAPDKCPLQGVFCHRNKHLPPRPFQPQRRIALHSQAAKCAEAGTACHGSELGKRQYSYHLRQAKGEQQGPHCQGQPKVLRLGEALGGPHEAMEVGASVHAFFLLLQAKPGLVTGFLRRLGCDQRQLVKAPALRGLRGEHCSHCRWIFEAHHSSVVPTHHLSGEQAPAHGEQGGGGDGKARIHGPI